MIRSYRFGLAVAVATLVIASLNAGPASTPYQRLALPSLSGPGPGAVAFGINDRGQIVGYSVFGRRMDDEGGEEDVVHAVLWQQGVITDLGTLAGGDSVATAINNAGQIVGFSDGRAVMWDRGTIVDLGTLAPDVVYGSSWSYAKAINNRGQIVGEGNAAGNEQCTHAILWDRGAIVDLGTLNGGACEWPDHDSSIALAINDRGQVAGRSAAPGGFDHAVVWDRGRMVDLGPAGGGHSSEATGINNRGEVIGTSGYPALWRHGRITQLEVPLGGGRLWPIAINERGQVIGQQLPLYGNENSTGPRPLLWEGGTLSMALGTRGYPLAINARGDVVGYDFDGPSRPRDLSAYLWTR